MLRYALKSDQGSADHGTNTAGHLLPHGDRRADKGDRTATRSLAGIKGRPGRDDNVGKHGCVVARPTLALRLVEVLFHLRLVQVLTGCQSKAGRDLLFGWLLLRLQVIHGYSDALVAYLVRVLGDERVHIASAQVLDLGRRGIEGHDAHLILFARLSDSRSGALPREDVGTEDAFEVGVRPEG